MTLVVNNIALVLLNHSKRNNTILAIGLLCILSILCNVFYWEGEYDEINFWGEDNDFISRSLSIQDSEGPQHHLYETLIPPSQIDYTVDERLSYYPDNEDNCNDILLYMPYEHSINGQGAQLNAYIKVSLLATFLNKALVIIEADNFHTLSEWSRHMPANTLYDSGSQFGCPVDAFDGEEMISNFPKGLSRIIQHPRWIGRGCPVPTCGGTMNYNSWEMERSRHISFMRRNKQLHDISCEEGGRQVKVTALGSSALNRAFHLMTGIQQKMLDRSTSESRASARQWAMRLGASEEDAHSFSEIRDPNQIWDYLSALVNRSGLLRFQPWVARDVQEHIQSMNLPLDGPYDAFHIRRGDKLLSEAKKWVKKYWNSNGRVGKQVTNYIPFSYYVTRAWGKCKAKAQVKKRNLKDPQVKTVYIATDDPDTVRQEINSIPRVNGKGASLVDECNHKVNFVFAPTPKDKAFHINDRRTGDDCHQVYKRNIAAISDLMILIRSQKFVGDYNSNWGRFIKVARSFLNTDGARPLVFKKPIIAVFGNMHPGVPGS